MRGLTEIIGPASETYAGFAWEYLRRNPEYCAMYRNLSHRNSLHYGLSTGHVRYECTDDNLAHKWGLECFENPKRNSLTASVFWRQEVFPSALSVQYHLKSKQNADQATFKLSNFACQKQHYSKLDGGRIIVVQTQELWLQLSGNPYTRDAENESFSVVISGRLGARRRIDALRQLTSLSRNGLDEFKLLGRQKTFMRLRNALQAYDIRADGGSYKDVAAILFGHDLVANEWSHSGGFLKARAIRAFKLAERMVAQDYRKLLPKKAI